MKTSRYWCKGQIKSDYRLHGETYYFLGCLWGRIFKWSSRRDGTAMWRWGSEPSSPEWIEGGMSLSKDHTQHQGGSAVGHNRSGTRVIHGGFRKTGKAQSWDFAGLWISSSPIWLQVTSSRVLKVANAWVLSLGSQHSWVIQSDSQTENQNA